MKKSIVKETNESSINIKEIWTSDILNINWCNMFFERKNKIQVHDSGEFVELYFQFNGMSESLLKGEKIVMPPSSQGVFYVNNYTTEHTVCKVDSKPLCFLEVRLDINTVKDMFPEELWKEQDFMKKLLSSTPSQIDTMKPISPKMKSIIWNMCNSPFNGIMQKTYLDAQIIELFLLQVDSHTSVKNNKLKKADIDKLVASKEYIDKNYLEKIRIVDLAKLVGTNQQLLRAGFKLLYGSTIFDYYNDLRMDQAKHLLVDKEKLVAEVADNIGYKNPQHFTVAFKKKFGVLPKEFKRC